MLQSDKKPTSTPIAPVEEPSTPTSFDQPVLLQQSPVWSRAIVWGIVGISAFTVIWASVFKIEEAIPATGKLEPQGSVKEIQVPVGGLVKDVFVEDGQRVKKGDRLLSLDPTAAQAQQVSLVKTRNSLLQENEFYRRQLAGTLPAAQVDQQSAQLRLAPELASLTRSRAALLSENQLYRAQLLGASGTMLSPEQQLRLRTRQTEVFSKLSAAQLQSGQAEQQLQQTQTKLANARSVLQLNQSTLSDMEPLMREGAIARLQYRKQQQDVLTKQAEVEQLTQEQQRLKLVVAQSNEEFRNTAALSQEDIFSRITENEKRIADIDGQLTKVILDNQKRINEIDSQLSQAQLTLRYQEVLSPVNGTIFELKAQNAGYVANSTQPVLKIVPNDNLIAKVYITNQDIGFVQEGQAVDVRIDSFPFSEYGDVKGKLVSIGSDALPPDEVYSYYRFPAKVQLDRQTLNISNREVALQSGMSVNANIKLRKRTVMSIFTDLFLKKVESLKFVR